MYRDDGTVLPPANLAFDPAGIPLSLSAPDLPVGTKEASYLGRAPSGENQMLDGPCGIYALASIIEVCERVRIVDSERKEAYKLAIRRANRATGDGLTIPECVAAGIEIGWLPRDAMAVPASAEMILVRPLLGGYKVNDSIDLASATGVLNHSDGARRSAVRGYHAMTILAYGWIGGNAHPVWVGENSWGRQWGDNGLWTCLDSLHRDLCVMLYYVKGLRLVP